MTEGSAPPGGERRTEGAAPLPLSARVATTQRRIMRLPPVAAFLDVQRGYDQAGGAMLAAGLSFFALFTVVPALLLFVGALAWVIDDQATRDRIVAAVVDQVPPLADVARAVLDGVASTAPAGTLVGFLGLLWGASGFYGALQGAMLRLFPGPRTRDPVRTRLMGVISVVVVLGSVIAAILVGLSVPLASDLLGVDLSAVDGLLAPALACLVGAAASLVVYVAVPPDGPGLRVALVPAILAGVVIGLLTSFFGIAAPFLVRNAPALGLLGAVFVTLVWFNLVFQVLLYGGALARLRRDRRRMRALDTPA